MIEVSNLSFSYNAGRDDAIPALHHVNLRIAPGEMVAIIGANGSGKSTLARLLAALTTPTEGSVHVDGLQFSAENAWEIRRRVGLVFQRPDDQLIANTVIDDVAFGPENLGLPRAEIEQRVGDALAALGMANHASAQISELSGGDKQRVAIAGVLAMQANYLVLDEPTTMLPPRAASDLIDLVHSLRDRLGTAVVHITHFIREVTRFDRVIVMDRGRIAIEGPPREVFARVDELQALGLDVPQVTHVARRLQAQGVRLPDVVLTVEELIGALAHIQLTAPNGRVPTGNERPYSDQNGHAIGELPLLETRDLHFTYLEGTPLASEALRGVNCQIHAGETVAILGGPQAGKSTLIEFFNALRIAKRGQVLFEGRDVASKDFNRGALREAVGIVFQQPELQLFEDSVGKDVSFAPRQKKLPAAESRALVAKALTDVGLDYETFRLRYIHALSGGQKRRVALAGVLAAQPRVLILDEPVAGLDPRGRAELAALITDLTKRLGLTVVLLGNAIDELAELAQRAIVLYGGQVVMEGPLRQLLRRADELHAMGLELGEVAEIALKLRAVLPVPTDVLQIEELETAILAALRTQVPEQIAVGTE